MQKLIFKNWFEKQVKKIKPSMICRFLTKLFCNLIYNLFKNNTNQDKKK